MNRFAEWTHGRWPEIVSALLGNEWANTRKHQSCPSAPQSTDCFRFADRTGTGNYFCRCSEGEKGGFDLLMCRLGIDFMDAVKRVEGVIGPCPREDEQAPKQKRYAEVLTEQCQRTQQSAYLAGRGLIVPPGLRWHPAVEYRDSEGKVTGRYPAMLAPIMRAGKFCTFHVTYLQSGKKAPVSPNRKVLPGPQWTGGAVPLWPAAEKMGIAEGVESAIAASMLYGIPVWAGISTSGMAGFQPPAKCEELTIFADNDANYAGHVAAYKLAHKLHGRVDVRIEFPTEVGTDFNDVLLVQREAA